MKDKIIGLILQVFAGVGISVLFFSIIFGCGPNEEVRVIGNTVALDTNGDRKVYVIAPSGTTNWYMATNGRVTSLDVKIVGPKDGDLRVVREWDGTHSLQRFSEIPHWCDIKTDLTLERARDMKRHVEESRKGPVPVE